ncbi:MAG: hypothetical protein ACOYVF_06235 [Candidatus Zixiibacteriota bacterium]
MKRMMTYLFCTMFLFSLNGSAFAVEKKVKKTEVKKTEVKKETPQADLKDKKTDSTSGKKYDTFVDKNNNGIDDRKENLKKKTTTTKKTEPTKTDEKK